MTRKQEKKENIIKKVLAWINEGKVKRTWIDDADRLTIGMSAYEKKVFYAYLLTGKWY